MPSIAKRLVGRRFSKLVVIGVAPRKPGNKHARVWVRCDCSTEKSVRCDALVNGSTRNLAATPAALGTSPMRTNPPGFALAPARSFRAVFSFEQLP
jgi:hypothetical protein